MLFVTNKVYLFEKAVLCFHEEQLFPLLFFCTMLYRLKSAKHVTCGESFAAVQPFP